MRFQTTSILLLTASFAAAQSELVGYRQYPQFRTSSGFPGSGLPIGADGKAGSKGALAVSIPVAYSLTSGQFVAGGSFTSDSMSISDLGRSDATDFGNGSAWLMAGLDGSWGSATLRVMFLIGTLDDVINVQYQLPLKGKLAVSAGVQDLIGDGGASGDVIDAVHDLSSRSFFGVASYPLSDRVFATAGIGTNRFRFGFVGASWNINDLFSTSLEHDGFNFNGSIVWHPRSWNVGGRSVRPALQIATIRGKYLQLGVNFGF